MVRVHTNSSPSYVSSLVPPCSFLQSRQALRSSSQTDFVVTRSLRKFGNRALASYSCTRLNGTSCQTSFANLHHYNFGKLKSRNTFSKFITTRLSSVTRFCAEASIPLWGNYAFFPPVSDFLPVSEKIFGLCGEASDITILRFHHSLWLLSSIFILFSLF